ncbi:MAG: transglutaminase family protein [Bacteroidales bacterium]|nr:transglutaminase family protein [Bacteroidales bacterium]
MSNHDENKELLALINLLDEPDIENFNNIRKSLFSIGKSSLPLLETTLENTFDEIVFRRIQNIIREIRFEEICKRLDDWVNSSSHNLLDALLLITKFQYPEIDETIIRNQISKIQKNIWLELNDGFTVLEKIKIINHILFEAYKFQVNINKTSFQNFFINNILETKECSSVSVGILYLILAKNLGVPVWGIDLPEQFILAYIDKDSKNNKTESLNSDVLFYINPTNKGSIFKKTQIDFFLKQLNIKPEKSHYNSCNNLTIIQRLLSELIIACEHSEFSDNVFQYQKLLKIVKAKNN